MRKVTVVKKEQAKYPDVQYTFYAEDIISTFLDEGERRAKSYMEAIIKENSMGEEDAERLKAAIREEFTIGLGWADSQVPRWLDYAGEGINPFTASYKSETNRDAGVPLKSKSRSRSHSRPDELGEQPASKEISKRNVVSKEVAEWDMGGESTELPMATNTRLFTDLAERMECLYRETPRLLDRWIKSIMYQYGLSDQDINRIKTMSRNIHNMRVF